VTLGGSIGKYASNNMIKYLLILFSVAFLISCGGNSTEEINRPSFFISINNTSSSEFSCQYVKYNDFNEFEIGRQKYENKILKILPGEVVKFTAFPSDDNSRICEVILKLNDNSKGVLFFLEDNIRNFIIKPGFLGAGSPG
jgi:hypothetical protein